MDKVLLKYTGTSIVGLFTCLGLFKVIKSLANCYKLVESLNPGLKFYSTSHARGYSSVVEHSTADREVPGSNPGAP
jgi:hypothetical protein